MQVQPTLSTIPTTSEHPTPVIVREYTSARAFHHDAQEMYTSGGYTVSGTSGALQVTSSGSYLDTSNTSRICTTDCGFLIARCQTSALAAGTTTFQHGGTTLTLTLPFMGAPPCAGAPGR